MLLALGVQIKPETLGTISVWAEEAVGMGYVEVRGKEKRMLAFPAVKYHC